MTALALEHPLLAFFMLCFAGTAGVLTAIAVAVLIRMALDQAPYWVAAYRVRRGEKRNHGRRKQ